MHKLYKGIVLLLIMVISQSCDQQKGNTLIINQDWKFQLLDDSVVSDTEYSEKEFDDTAWEKVSLPHSAHIEPLIVTDQWQGICWYRKSFVVPEEAIDKQVLLEMEAAMNHSKFWINGSLVKVHQGGYLPVVIDITNYIEKGKENVLAIRLNNRDNVITGPKPLKKLDFNMYGGLYRNAKLHIKEKVHISHPVLAKKVAGGGVFVTYPLVSNENSIVRVKTDVANQTNKNEVAQVLQKLFYKDQLVAEKLSDVDTVLSNKNQEFICDIDVKKANLWSPKNPNLYKLETSVWVDGKQVDRQTTKIGIRKFEFKGQDFYINGEKTFLRGVNRHQEYPFVGYALSDNAQYRDAVKIKEAGFNYIRLSHYPQSPAFMDACDELGLVVIDAILGWQYYLDNELFRKYCYRSARELIRRDRNRPSVMAWEVSLNETQMPVFFMEKLHKIVHREYPGPNVYSCGWMDDVYDIYLQARQHRILHPHKLKSKPYSVSEYGDWEYFSSNAGLNQDLLPKNVRKEKSSRQARGYGEARLLQQAANIQEAHNDNLSTVAYSDSYWVMYDYNRGYYDDLEESGIMDIFRLPKFGYYFYQSQRPIEEGLVLQIASYWNDKSPLNVKVYSNCDEVKLLLNNQVIALQKPDNNEVSINLNHPPFTFKLPSFEAGVLKAVGYVNGKEVMQTEVETPRQPIALKIWLDESGIAPESGVNDVVFLYIAAIDKNGTIVPDFSEEVHVEVDDKLIVVNPNKIVSEAGIATALVKIKDRSGKTTVKAKSNKLEGSYSFKIR